VFMHEDSHSLSLDNSVLHNPLHHSHASPLCSLPSHSTKYYTNMPIGNPMIYGANIHFGYEDNTFISLVGMLIIFNP